MDCSVGVRIRKYECITCTNWNAKEVGTVLNYKFRTIDVTANKLNNRS